MARVRSGEAGKSLNLIRDVQMEPECGERFSAKWGCSNYPEDVGYRYIHEDKIT